MPLNLIFRSSTLLANMALGKLIFKKRYDNSKYCSVVFVSIGIFMCTLASGSDIATDHDESSSEFFWWIVGVVLMSGMRNLHLCGNYLSFLLSATLYLTAYMGLYQENMYKRCGKHPEESLFYTHILPMPAFLCLAGNICSHINRAIESPGFYVPIFNIYIPIQFIYLFANALMHFICIKSVYVLLSECSSLTVTLVVTLRKFLSLVFSVFFFKNSFSMNHWIGTAFVFLGTIVYTEVIPKIKEAFESSNTTIITKSDSNFIVKVSTVKYEMIPRTH